MAGFGVAVATEPGDERREDVSRHFKEKTVSLVDSEDIARVLKEAEELEAQQLPGIKGLKPVLAQETCGKKESMTFSLSIKAPITTWKTDVEDDQLIDDLLSEERSSAEPSKVPRKNDKTVTGVQMTKKSETGKENVSAKNNLAKKLRLALEKSSGTEDAKAAQPAHEWSVKSHGIDMPIDINTSDLEMEFNRKFAKETDENLRTTQDLVKDDPKLAPPKFYRDAFKSNSSLNKVNKTIWDEGVDKHDLMASLGLSDTSPKEPSRLISTGLKNEGGGGHARSEKSSVEEMADKDESSVKESNENSLSFTSYVPSQRQRPRRRSMVRKELPDAFFMDVNATETQSLKSREKDSSEKGKGDGMVAGKEATDWLTLLEKGKEVKAEKAGKEERNVKADEKPIQKEEVQNKMKLDDQFVLPPLLVEEKTEKYVGNLDYSHELEAVQKSYQQLLQQLETHYCQLLKQEKQKQQQLESQLQLKEHVTQVQLQNLLASTRLGGLLSSGLEVEKGDKDDPPGTEDAMDAKHQLLKLQQEYSELQQQHSKLEMECSQLKLELDGVKTKHEHQLQAVEETHRWQLELMVSSHQRIENFLQEQTRRLTDENKNKVEHLKQSNADVVSHLEERIERLQSFFKKHLQDLQTGHCRSIEDLRAAYQGSFQRFCEVNNVDVAAQKQLAAQVRSVEQAVDQLGRFTQQLSLLLQQLESSGDKHFAERESALEAKKNKYRASLQKFKQQQEKLEEKEKNLSNRETRLQAKERGLLEEKEMLAQERKQVKEQKQQQLMANQVQQQVDSGLVPQDTRLCSQAQVEMDKTLQVLKREREWLAADRDALAKERMELEMQRVEIESAKEELTSARKILDHGGQQLQKQVKEVEELAAQCFQEAALKKEEGTIALKEACLLEQEQKMKYDELQKLLLKVNEKECSMRKLRLSIEKEHRELQCLKGSLLCFKCQQSQAEHNLNRDILLWTGGDGSAGPVLPNMKHALFKLEGKMDDEFVERESRFLRELRERRA